MSTDEIQPGTSRKRGRKESARAAAVAAVKGKYARVGTSSRRFATSKRSEIEREYVGP